MKDLKKHFWILILAFLAMALYKIMFDFDSLMGWWSLIVGTLSPFIAGFIIAFCINIPVSFLDGKLKRAKVRWVVKLSRGISIIVNYILLLAFLAFGLSIIIPMIYRNVTQLVSSVPGWIEQGFAAVQKLPFAEQLGISQNADIREIIKEQQWTNFLPSDNTEIVWRSVGMAQSLFSGMLSGVLTLVSSIYFLVEYNDIKDFFKRIIRALSKDDEKQNATIKYVRLVERSFRKFLTCQFLDSLILGTLATIEFLILGSPYALVLGIMLGVVNIIPYFGSIFGSLVAILITAFSNGLETAVLTAIILLITQQIDGNFINPKIMGTSFSVSPVLVVIGITIGGAIGGVAGMIFAVPVVNVLKTLLEEYVQNREKVKAGIPINYNEEEEEREKAEKLKAISLPAEKRERKKLRKPLDKK